MKITIELPAVGECSVAECAYNTDNRCHARAITIGDGITPNCDTLFCGSGHIHATNVQAGVGACKVGSCGFNNDLECTAGSITVGLVDENVECLTYMMR
jgi:hypothetical protein